MNKFMFACALVAVFAMAAVSANRLHRGRPVNSEEELVEPEFEEHRPHVHRPGRKNLHQIDEAGSQPINRHPRRGGLRRGPVVKGAGAGAFGAAGVRSEGELDAGVHSGTRLGSHKSIEGHKGFVAGGKKEFNAGVNRHDLNDNEGHSRHSVTNKNKLIVKESDNGFNDDTGFHSHNEHSDGAHISGSEGKIIGGKKGGRITSDQEFEHDHEAGLHAEHSKEAGIAGGVGAGIGAAEF